MLHLGDGGLGLQDILLGGGAGLLLAAHAAPGATSTRTELYTKASIYTYRVSQKKV